MRKWIVFIVGIVLLVSGCNYTSLSVPPLEKHHVLITHIKEPMLAVVDLKKSKIIYEEVFEFNIQSLARIDHHQLAVAGKLESEVLLIDLYNGEVRTLLSPVSSVTDLFYDDAHQMLVLTDAKHNEAVLFDMDKEEIIKRIKVGSYPNSISADESFLYVLNGDHGTVSVIDLFTYEVVRTFPVVEHPTDIVVNGRNVWVGGHGSYGELNEYVHIYDASTGKLVEKVKAGSMPIAFYTDERDEDMFVLSHGSNEMHIIDKESFRVKEKIETSDNPYYVTADEQHIYVTALDGDTLLLVDRKTYAVTEEYALQAGPYGIVLGGRSHE
ncbi:YncE family protein [Pueribacillus sp. YX66]|uniref:YncE family protein n=1 Tax=Pueribacillus sp. YX66 TaxID=3229242 RepID=UPI00358D1433